MKETQCAAILDHLKRHGSITPLEALNRYGCMRLGARIYDLKRSGYEIESRLELHKNENGEYTKFARYALKGADHEDCA